MQHARIDGSCRPQRIEDRHPEVHHSLNLTRIVAVRKNTDIAATGNRDASVKRRLKDASLTFGIRTGD